MKYKSEVVKVNTPGGTKTIATEDYVDGIVSSIDKVVMAKNPPSAGAVIEFGRDANGNYGYVKAGADTVTPFKAGVLAAPIRDAEQIIGYSVSQPYAPYISVDYTGVGSATTSFVAISLYPPLYTSGQMNVISPKVGGEFGSHSFSGKAYKYRFYGQARDSTATDECYYKVLMLADRDFWLVLKGKTIELVETTRDTTSNYNNSTVLARTTIQTQTYNWYTDNCNLTIAFYIYSPDLVFVTYKSSTSALAESALALRAIIPLNTFTEDAHKPGNVATQKYRITNAVTVGHAETSNAAGTYYLTGDFGIVPLQFGGDCRQFGLLWDTIQSTYNASGELTGQRHRAYFESLRVLSSNIAIRTTTWTTICDVNGVTPNHKSEVGLFDYFGCSVYAQTNATNGAVKTLINPYGSWGGAPVLETKDSGLDNIPSGRINIIGQMPNGWLVAYTHYTRSLEFYYYDLAARTTKKTGITGRVELTASSPRVENRDNTFIIYTYSNSSTRFSMGADGMLYASNKYQTACFRLYERKVPRGEQFSTNERCVWAQYIDTIENRSFPAPVRVILGTDGDALYNSQDIVQSLGVNLGYRK